MKQGQVKGQIKGQIMFVPMLTMLAASTACSGSGEKNAESVKQPNVILIMADDLGYADISCFGSTTVNTPNLDKMASEGMKLTNYHSNGAVSSPTRAALMTGKYQQRVGITGVITAASHREVGLDLNETTIAERLSDNGYTCGMFGKWHLGYPAEYNPSLQGFDIFRGYVAGNVDYHSHVDQSGYFDWWKNCERSEDKGYITDLITNYSVDFIQENNPKDTGKPFFLYIPYATPHYPYQGRYDEPVREEGNPKYIRKVAGEDIPQIYVDIIENMDEGIGTVMQTLKDLDIDDNTIVLFCSDNGPSGPGNNGGYRGKKGSVYEGGHRVPGIVRYPSKIKSGAVSDATILGMDLFPTFLDFAGDKAPQEGVDGVSVKNTLLEGVQIADRDLFWEHMNVTAMRRGDWKLIHHKDKESGEDVYELYNLANDKSESNNLVESEPNLVKEMAAAIDAWTKDVNSGVKEIS